jgi:hypothetical protein
VLTSATPWFPMAISKITPITIPRPPTHFNILIPEAECDRLLSYFVLAMFELDI